MLLLKRVEPHPSGPGIVTPFYLVILTCLRVTSFQVPRPMIQSFSASDLRAQVHVNRKVKSYSLFVLDLAFPDEAVRPNSLSVSIWKGRLLLRELGAG